jgi:hypothetical protein
MGGTGGTAGAGAAGGKATGSGGAAAGAGGAAAGAGGQAAGGAGAVGGNAAGSGGAAVGSGGAAAGSGGQAAGGAGGVGGKATGSGGAAAGSGGQAAGGAGGAGVVHPLPGATEVDIQSGHCVTINAVAQTLPQSVVSFDLTDSGGGNNYRVAIVPSSYTCGWDPLEGALPPYLDALYTGSVHDSAQLPAGDYSLDLICENAVNDCLIDIITWSATY